MSSAHLLVAVQIDMYTYTISASAYASHRKRVVDLATSMMAYSLALVFSLKVQ
jgi:hypothetical protein